MSIVNKSIQTDFGGNFYPQDFDTQLRASSSLNSKYVSFTVFSDTVQITFTSPLDAGENTALNTIISNNLPNLVEEVPASQISADPTNFKVLTSTNVQTLWDQTDTALLNRRGTGLRFGGEVTGLGDTGIQIASGEGAILDNTAPENPLYYPLSWGNTGIALPGNGSYYTYINESGQPILATDVPDDSDFRTKLYLARISMTGGVITGLSSICVPVQQINAQLRDLSSFLGSIKSGLEPTPNGTDLRIKILSGLVFSFGSNFHTDPLNPHEIAYSERSPITFRHVISSGVITTDRTTLDVANYEFGGVVTAIPGNNSRATIFTIYMFPTGNVRILYGNQFYSDLATAFSQLGSYTPNPPSGFTNNAIILGYIIATKVATNLSLSTDARFVVTNKFGGVGGAIAVSLGNFLQSGNNLSDVSSVSTARSNLMIARTVNLNSATAIGGSIYIAQSGNSATEAETSIISPFSGILKNLNARIQSGTLPAGGDTRVITARVNGSNTGLTVTFTNGGATFLQNVLTNIAVNAGDLISILTTITGTASNSIVWVSYDIQ